MTTCLDTNVLVDVLGGRRPEVRLRYQAELSANRNMVVSSLTAHELAYGAFLSRRPDQHWAELQRLLAQLDVIEWSAEDAYAAARLRARLRREGQTIGNFHALIAGQALSRGWTLVTANIREFVRVEGLILEDWTQP